MILIFFVIYLPNHSPLFKFNVIMNKVNDILNRKGNKVISVLPEASVKEALMVMAQNNMGSVIVMEGDSFLGIMTERDYSRKIILKGKNSTDTKVRDIMATDFPNLNLNDTVAYCMELMNEKNIRYLPVFVEGKLRGIISISDVISETLISQQQTIEHLDSYINSI